MILDDAVTDSDLRTYIENNLLSPKILWKAASICIYYDFDNKKLDCILESDKTLLRKLLAWMCSCKKINMVSKYINLINDDDIDYKYIEKAIQVCISDNNLDILRLLLSKVTVWNEIPTLIVSYCIESGAQNIYRVLIDSWKKFTIP